MSTLQAYSTFKTESISSTTPNNLFSPNFLPSQSQFEEDEWHVVEDPKKKRLSQNIHLQRGSKRRGTKKGKSEKDTATNSEASQNGKKEKRLDRQLYSVREKMNKIDENAVKKSSTKHYVDDSKSCTSNASTAISDQTKQLDDPKETSAEIIDQENQNESLDILMNVLAQRGEFTEFYPIYKREQDYESHLNEVCIANDLFGVEALIFKINIMTAVTSIESDWKKAQEYLDHLLDENYKRLSAELEIDQEYEGFDGFCDASTNFTD